MSGVGRFSEQLLQRDRRALAVLLGLALGLVGGAVGLGIVLFGPEITFGGVVGLLVGLYLLTDLNAALYAVLAVVALFPFGTIPVRIGLIPTFLDVALGTFLLVYLFQWMTGRRRLLQTTWVHNLVLIFGLMLLFSFIAGLGHALLTTNVLRQFAEMLLSIFTALVLVDVIRDEQTLRRVMLALLLMGGLTALLGVGLYVLPDVTAERLLVTLSRFGYPDGGVIRYVESNPALPERAIGVWVDPNAFGGILAVLGALAGTQVFASRPLGGRRWLMVAVSGAVMLCLALTFSRGAVLALGGALTFVAAMRYRRLLLVMALVVGVALLLPVTQNYVGRFVEAFQIADLATQMRVGEIRDTITLIGRYPVLGVGFAGTPEIDLYLGVANLYLTMASNIGLVGLGVYLATIAGLFIYGWRAWRLPGRSGRFEAIWLGTHAGIVAALAAGLTDHYFFKLEFQASGTLFWLVFGLALSTSRLWRIAAAQDTGDEVESV